MNLLESPVACLVIFQQVLFSEIVVVQYLQSLNVGRGNLNIWQFCVLALIDSIILCHTNPV